MVHIILPVYNEAGGLTTLLERIRTELHDIDYEVLAVDDGSTDGSGAELSAMAARMPVRILRHTINRGLWETIRDGFEFAASAAAPGDVIVRMDADDTHDPRYIRAMLQKIREGYDVVIASRFQPGGGAEGLIGYRAFISRCANLLMKAVFPIKGVWEYSCGYRAYRAELVQESLRIFGNNFIDLKGVGFTCTIEKLLKFRLMGARFAEVPFVLRYDQKLSASKMLSSLTTIGYLVLILKYIYPWGPQGKEWQRQTALYKQRRAGEPAA
jgi:dolichol-phosphate mannosyltransferase